MAERLAAVSFDGELSPVHPLLRRKGCGEIHLVRPRRTSTDVLNFGVLVDGRGSLTLVKTIVARGAT